MKKIKFAIASIFIIIFIIAIFASAAEVKKALPAVPTVPVNVAPAATPRQIQQSPVPPAANIAPAVAIEPKQIQQPPSIANVAPAVVPTSIDNYSYNPSGKPDPFRPLVEAVKPEAINVKKQVAIKAEASMFPLQRAETEKYRVVGIAGDKDHRVAIAEDSAKKFYPLLIGTHIGLYNGKVIEIMADRVIVEEYETKKAKRVILKLRRN
jgi:type IV pilus assembly protein PilP